MLVIVLIAIAIISPVIGCLMAYVYIRKLERLNRIYAQELGHLMTRTYKCDQQLSKYNQPRAKNGRFKKKIDIDDINKRLSTIKWEIVR